MNLRAVIDRVYDSWERNNFGKLGMSEETMFLRPAIGVAAGDDPYFAFLKEHIGPFHWSPAEAFALEHGEADPASLRVISLVFPQTDLTKGDQRRAVGFPSDRWMVARGEWESLMEEFCGNVISALAAVGVPAVAIDLLPQWKRESSEKLGIASSWSHRHAAFAAGMGTFGLSDGFITEYGKAVRLTSFVVRSNLPVTDRQGRGPYDWCLYYVKGTCGVCMKRCPVGAITVEGHDKNRCSDFAREGARNFPDHIDHSYTFGCGLCQTAIPCQNKRPV